MPFLFCCLVAWYLVNWVEKAVVNGAARVTARTAEKLAGAAERLGERGQGIRDRAAAVAGKLWGRPAPAEPRTRAGQRLAEKTAHATGRALGGIIGWLAIMWTDAKAAAESAQARRTAGRGMWWSWPTGDDPQAPVQATAQRLDDQAQPDTAAASSADADRGFRAGDQEHVEAGKCAWTGDDGRSNPESNPEPQPVDDQPAGPVRATAQRLDQDHPAQPAQLAFGPLVITDGRNNTMETAAESGLGAYLSYSTSMSNSCQNGVSSVEATIAALESQDWSGVPVDAMRQAMEALSTAATAFTEAHSAFQAALAVREQYQANSHTGTKESVMAD